MKQDKENKVREYIEDYVPCFTPCIGCEMTEKYIDIFGKKMGLRRLEDDNIDAVEIVLGFTLTEKDKKDFIKIWMEIFKRVMLEYQVELRKCKNEEEKEKLKKEGCKRKPQGDTGKKKKKK